MPTPSLILVPARFKTGKLYTPVATTSGGLVLGASGDFNVTRATTATRVNASGLVEVVAAGIPRLDYSTSGGCPALLVENAATNLALHSRDLTNAVWSGTNVTTEKNAVGADGVASGATTITATAASGTVLQALSHASQSRVFSAYIRRVTGTGAIQLTTNGGTNWDTVTITSAYTQVFCAAQTIASGTVGIRLAASGDVIAVDFTQGEAGPVATSPIATTSGTVTRNSDDVNLSGPVSGCIGQTEGTIYLEIEIRATVSPAAMIVVLANDSGLSQYIRITRASSLFTATVFNSPNATTLFASATGTVGIYKLALAYKSGDNAMSINGATPLTSANASNYPTSLTRIMLSEVLGGGFRPLNGPIRAFALYPTRLSNSELIALTT
jgi:hypothetical protein